MTTNCFFCNYIIDEKETVCPRCGREQPSARLAYARKRKREAVAAIVVVAAVVISLVLLLISWGIAKYEAKAEVRAAAIAEMKEALPKLPEEVLPMIEEVAEVETEEVVLSCVEPELVSLGEFKITHYCACEKCCGKWANGITATGAMATAGRTIAVDPKVIPYGTEVLVRFADGREHIYVAEDCGGAIDGNKLDIFMASHGEAIVAGVKTAEVFLVEDVK